jgi:hypothetical protein
MSYIITNIGKLLVALYLIQKKFKIIIINMDTLFLYVTTFSMKINSIVGPETYYLQYIGETKGL